jgi:hypothetical protein
MINVNKITSTLAKLPDQQLQQYAQMHKSDPYIMALAMSESNRRKEMRSAGQGAQGMQEQPKVVDQMVADMAPQQLPEDQGIGQLPAGNMNFASGGIIAFADGGDVERYQFGGALSGEFSGFGGMSPEQTAAAEIRAAEEARLKQLDELQKKVVFLTSVGAPQAQEAQAQLAALTASMQPKPSPTDPNFRRQEDPRMKPGVAATARPLITSGAAPKADTTQRSLSGAPKPEPAAAPAQTAAQRYADMQKGLEPDRTNIDKGIAALGTSMRTAAKGELEDFEKDVAERGVAFKGREERLAKREEGLSKRKDENMGLSLLEAGLAIMSTPGSLATAIGKGAQTGLKTYGTGLKDLRAAQEKMDDARDQIEEFRRNEANMTAKERRQFKSAINRTETDIEKLSLSAAEKMYGYKREDAKTVFTADTQERLTDKEIAARKELSAIDNAARERIAQIPQGQERLAMLLGGGDLAKGLAKFTEIQAGKFNPTTAYTDYISKRKEGDTVLTPQEFVTQIRSIQALMGGAPGVSNKPTGKAFE